MSPVRNLLVGALALLAAATGCRSGAPKLTFTSLEGRGELVQRFSSTAMTRDDRGYYDVVLVAQGVENIEKGDPGSPLSPAASPPVRQVVHLKLNWRPRAGAKSDNPASSNATVRWFIFGSTSPEGPRDLVEYQGTAFVRPVFEKEGYTLLIRNGELTRTKVTGDMMDAIGRTRFEGKFYVPDDAITVANVLKDLPAPTFVEAPKGSQLLRPPTQPTTRKP